MPLFLFLIINTLDEYVFDGNTPLIVSLQTQHWRIHQKTIRATNQEARNVGLFQSVDHPASLALTAVKECLCPPQGRADGEMQLLRWTCHVSFCLLNLARVGFSPKLTLCSLHVVSVSSVRNSMFLLTQTQTRRTKRSDGWPTQMRTWTRLSKCGYVV